MKIEDGVCPKCGSTNVDHDGQEHDSLNEGLMKDDCLCGKCGCEFSNSYVIEFIGIYVGDKFHNKTS